jgi:hypothetical protein
VKVQRKSLITGNETVRDLPITQAQLQTWLSGGRMIQEVFPHLSAGDREFLLTGITEQEWDETFSKPEEEV